MMRIFATAAVCLLTPLSADGNDERRNPFGHTLAEPAAVVGTELESVAEDELLLNAVLVAGGKSLVSVNGVVFGVGEQSFGYKLLAVTAESATFERDGEIVTLLLFDERQRGLDRER